MKTLLALAFALTLTAADRVPSQQQLEGALYQASAGWNMESPFPIQLRVEPLNACVGKVHDVATTQVTDSWSTLTTGSADPVTTHSYTVLILVNASCDWSRLDLVAVMTHEYGHVLLGAAYHSRDKRSIMYPVVGGKQTITARDRELVREKYQISE